MTEQFPSPTPTYGTDSAAAARLRVHQTRAAHCPSKKGKCIFVRLLSIVEALGGWRHTRIHPREEARQVEKGTRSNWRLDKRTGKQSKKIVWEPHLS